MRYKALSDWTRFEMMEKQWSLATAVSRFEASEKQLIRMTKRKLGAHPDIPTGEHDDVLQTVRMKVWRSLYADKVKRIGKSWLARAIDWSITDYQRQRDPLARHTRDRLDWFKKEKEFWGKQGLQIDEIIEAMGLTYQEFVELQSLEQLECIPFSQFEKEKDDDTSPVWEIAHRHYDTDPIREQAQALLDCLSDANQKELIRQLCWEGLTQQEVAIQREVSPATVSREYKRVLKKIRSEYEIRSKTIN